MSRPNPLRFELEFITPDLAAEYLGRMRPNRAVNSSRSKLYAECMASDNWELTHQAIAFDTDGRLCDGQHRLRACIRAQAIDPDFEGFWSYVAYGLTPKALACVDGGQARSMAAALTIAGIKVTGRETGIARLIRGAFKFGETGYWETQRQRHDIIVDTIDKYRDGMTFAGALQGKKLVGCNPVQAAVAIAYYEWPERRDKIARFMEILAGAETVAECPARRLRSFLLSQENDRGQGSGRQFSVYGRASKCLRAFVEGVPMPQLRAPVAADLLIPSAKIPPSWYVIADAA